MQFEKTYELPYQARDVFAAWTSPEAVVPPATRLDLNPVVGGYYRLILETPEQTSRAEGIFFAVEKDRRVRYTWEWNRDGEITEIEVTFKDCESGSRLKILHSGFHSEESCNQHKIGWDNYVEGLEGLLAANPMVEAIKIGEETA